MPKQYGSKEAAEFVGTDTKRLRQFLRQDSTYTNAAQRADKRYVFEKKDLPTLKRRFLAWQEKTSAKAAPTRRRTRRNSDGTMPEYVASIPADQLPANLREERDRISRERVDRLEERLKAAGLHISQIRDRVS